MRKMYVGFVIKGKKMGTSTKELAIILDVPANSMTHDRIHLAMRMLNLALEEETTLRAGEVTPVQIETAHERWLRKLREAKHRDIDPKKSFYCTPCNDVYPIEDFGVQCEECGASFCWACEERLFGHETVRSKDEMVLCKECAEKEVTVEEFISEVREWDRRLEVWANRGGVEEILMSSFHGVSTPREAKLYMTHILIQIAGYYQLMKKDDEVV